MYSRFIRMISPLYIFLFSFFIVSQLGRHFFFPFSYLSGIRIDYLAPTIYLTDILSVPFIVWSILSLFNQRGAIKQWILQNGIFIGTLVILVLINFVFSLSKPLWFYYSARILHIMLLFLFFRSVGNQKRVYSSIIGGLLLGGCVELILSLLQLSARHSLQGVWYFLGERSFSIFTPGIAKAYFMGKEFLRPYGTFSHPNSLGGFYLLIYTFVLTQKRITNIFVKRIFLFISSALILISFSRSAIIAYVVINLFYLGRNIVTCKTCFLAKVSVAFVLILFALNISGDLNSLQKRTDFFEKSISIITQKPFSGTGVGSYLIAQHQYPQKFSTFFEQPVHNIFLLLVAQLGIPLCLLLFSKMYYAKKIVMQNLTVLLPFLCIFITGNVDHYWITLQQNLLVLVLLSGMLWVAPQSKI